MFKYSISTRFLFVARDFFSRSLYKALREHCRGNVLDVGGASFFKTAIERKIPFEHWTVLESSSESLSPSEDPRVKIQIGDGCAMEYPSNSFDTVLNIQVLEHTFEPFKMFSECMRVLKPGGTAIFLIPQTGTIHLAPYHFQNFMRFWVVEAARRTGVKIESLEPLGGWWTTIGARLLLVFFTAFRRKGNSIPEIRRSPFFYLLFPLMAVYAIINLPITLFFGLADLKEEPLNHLVVIRK